jgi:hypothetical protein
MISRMLGGCLIVTLSCLYVRADVIIQVIRDDNKQPVANAKILIEPIEKNGKIIEEGMTDVKGIFIAKALPLPGKDAKVSITAYPPRATGLKATTEDYAPKEKDVIVVRLHKKPR